jgi:peptidyl-prolyl cis-trans isomerase SurA
MKKIDFGQSPWSSLIGITALVSSALLGGSFLGCSDAGLHLPAMLTTGPSKPQPAGDKASAELPKGELASAAPYAPPSAVVTNPDTIDSVVASVDGNPITSQDVKMMGASKPGGMTAQAIDPTGIPDDPNSKLKALITQQMMEQESRKYSDKVDDGDVDRMIQSIEERNHMTDEQLRTQLQSQGVSYATFRAKIRKQALAMAMFQHEVRDKAVVPDSEVEAFYKDHQDEFTITEEKYRLAQILIAVPAGATPEQVSGAQQRAEDAHKLAIKGQDFGDLARQYSDDDSKTKGGELGTFNPNELNDDIAAGIKNVKVGDVSKVIRTKFGFHLLKVEEHEIPGTVPLADVKAMIREKLQSEKSKDDLQKWVDQDLIKEHYVETSE